MPAPVKKKPQSALSYITRKAAIRKLQVTLKQFRKLCILKGIFPREPKKAQQHKGHGKIYYLTKDIQFLLHDPLIGVIRQQLTLKKKMKKAMKRGEVEVAKSLESQMPSLNLEHIIKERYPTFIDALRDLDDALCLLYTFSNFQSTKLFNSKRAINCGRRIKEWEAYVIKAQCLDKTFVSIKGIYYQAEVFGQKITWITSHKFIQDIPSKSNADLQIMLNFLEFYETMVAFVLYKLYNSMGLHYPPKLEEGQDEDDVLNHLLQKLNPLMDAKDPTKESNTNDKAQQSNNQKENKSQKESKKRISSLDSSKLLSLEQQNEQSNDKSEEKDELEKEFDKQQNSLENKTKNLFAGLKFFLSRETPRFSLELVIKSFGGEVYWEGSAIKEGDESITHQVIDRTVQSKMFLSRDYVQPQWVYDCVNEKVLLPTFEYGINAKLPPHLSPFVDDERIGYVPDRRKKLDKMRESILNGEPVLQEEEEEEEDKEEEDQDNVNDEDHEDTLENQYANELKAELAGKQYDEEEASKNEKKRAQKKKQKQEEDKKASEKLANDEALLLLSKKDRNLLNTRKKRKEMHGAHIQKLESKRQVIEEEEKKEKQQKKRAKKN